MGSRQDYLGSRQDYLGVQLDFSSGLPERRERRVVFHLLTGAAERGRTRSVATSLWLSERESITFGGIVEGLRLHDRKVPRNSWWERGAVVLQTRVWALICRGESGWHRAVAKLLNEGGDRPEAYVYYAEFE